MYPRMSPLANILALGGYNRAFLPQINIGLRSLEATCIENYFKIFLNIFDQELSLIELLKGQRCDLIRTEIYCTQLWSEGMHQALLYL